MRLPLLFTSILLMTMSLFAQQKLEPYQKRKVKSLETFTPTMPFQLPVAELSPKGNIAASIRVKAIQQLNLYSALNPKNNRQLSKSIHQHYIKQLQRQGYHPIFRCKDNCRSILKQILPKYLPSKTTMYKQLLNTKRYSYTILHKGKNVILCITLHDNSKEIMTLIGNTTFQ